MGEYPRGEHPNSRRNLIPFSRGDDPNRKVGSPNIGSLTKSFLRRIFQMNIHARHTAVRCIVFSCGASRSTLR